MDDSEGQQETPNQRLMLEFVAQFFSDQESETVRPVEDYLRQFPGDPEAIRLEYETLTSDSEHEDAFIGPYRILSELGRGGQGRVYLAEDSKLGRKVALKVLSAFSALSGPTLARFRRESMVAAQLNHPGICAVYETGIDAGVPYLVMQYIEGQTLAAELTEAQVASSTMVELTPSHATKASSDPHALELARVHAIARFIEDASRAAHMAHEAGFVHRDIKPGNIMVNTEGAPVLLDFGLVRAEEGEFPTLTQTGDVLGTPAYMAPEQLAGSDANVDRRTDVWAMGVTLYHCVSLQRPFQAHSREALFRQILEAKPPDPRTYNKSIPGDLAVIIATSMEKDRQRRYQSALDLAEDLRRFRAREPIHARPAGPWLRCVRWSQRNPVAVALIMSLLAGAIVSISLALRARSHLNDWERLADGHRLSELIEIADEDLWPAQPTRVEAMDHWLSDARELRGRLGDHRAALEGFRRLALPWTAHERELDRASHQVSSRRNDIDQRIAFLREQHEKISGDITKLRDHATVIGEATPSSRTQRRLEANSDRILDLEQRRDEFTEETRTLEQELEQLEQRSATRLTWTFEDPRDQIRHDGLRDLVTGLEALAGEGAVVFPPTIAAVKARRKFAQSLRDGEQARRRAWTEAGQRVSANAAYDDLALSPVVGLIPIGPDPDSGLEEFAHLQSGAIPERDLAEGGLKITEDTGLVFVLLPGATVQMGAQSGDSSMEHFDAEALGNEGPVHKVTLDPFLISKFEVTQAQWRRFTGSNPSIYHPDYEPYPSYDVTWRHPVENVDWPTAVAVLRRMGLRLPTESQWEYACRATTATPWWTGRLRDTLRGAANLADQAAARAGARWAAIKDWPDLDDGFPLHAPVGSLRANGFGLHDVHGNVWEWCQDGYVWYAQHPARPRDGLRMGGPSRDRIARGAGFKNAAESSRSAGRLIGAETTKDEGMGVRPVHALHHH